MNATELFSGVFPALVTPFDAEESIDHDQLRADVHRLEAAGVDGVVPTGSTGESATLTHDEHIEVVDTVVDAVDDIPVIAGTGSNNTREALSLTRRAAEAGADAALLLSPYYNKPEPAGMENHYRTIADEVDIPQVLYNVPSRTGREIDVETTAALAGHPNVQSYKAASGDLGFISEVVERTREEEFVVVSGDDGFTLPIQSVGGRGVISVAANVAPGPMCEMVWAASDGDYERARELHHALGPLFRAIFAETNPIPIKEALYAAGHHDDPPVVRSPLSRLSAEHRDHIADVVADL